MWPWFCGTVEPKLLGFVVCEPLAFGTGAAV
jgi:hypothetical protein